MAAEGDERTGQYFAAVPHVASAPERVDVALPDTSFSIETDRGVFSHGRLDAGTALLLRSRLPLPDEGDVVDLGCGSGAIALTMARRSPATRVWAVDVNRRAIELCRDNARRNGIANVRAVHPDEVPPELRVEAIWSNPPIRIGKRALHELLARWLGRLAPSAVAHLVVQKHLGADSLHRWLDDAGYHVARLASKGGYRILEVAAR